MRSRATSSLCVPIVLLLAACDGNDSPGGSGVGGDRGTGGQRATGGAATGGNSNPAGGSSSGGTTSTGGSDAGVVPPSCQSSGPGLTDCGANRENCCTSLKVPGGTFDRTYTNDGSGAKDQADPATIAEFRLDKYLVTVGRYRKFVAAWDGGSGYTPPIGSGKHTHLNAGQGLADSGAAGAYETGWTASDSENLAPTNGNLACQTDGATWTVSPGANEKLPINCVNWWEAYAFCIWDGGFLASEAEYAYAAAGGSQERRYPWGSDEPAKDNQLAIFGCNYPDGSGTCTGLANIAPVGTAQLGAGRWGQLDLVGDLSEWNLDWFAPSYVNPCTDCAYLASGSGRVMRDGFFASAPTNLLVSYRTSFYPTNRFNTFGFRCARTP